MSERIAQLDPVSASTIATQGSLSPGDLAELMSAFTEVTTKLERTHAQLRAEVARLNAELRDANEALQRSRRLAALGEMAAGISHEIRNPLGSIQLYSNMLRDDLASMPEQREVVEKIGRAVRGLDEIVGDVLCFAREINAKHRPCEIEAVIAGAIESCCAEVAGSVRVGCAGGPYEIQCDAGLIQQALVNILRNAGEANRITGADEIVIETAMRDIERDGRTERSISITVHDRGDGIPEQVIERMFNPFFTTRAAGTGLGLAIVHRIVDAHRGLVEVGNHQGRKGAWVRLVLPVSQPVVVVKSQSGSGSDVRTHSPQAGASPCVMR